MSIQSNINQTLGIGAALLTQTPLAKKTKMKNEYAQYKKGLEEEQSVNSNYNKAFDNYYNNPNIKTLKDYKKAALNLSTLYMKGGDFKSAAAMEMMANSANLKQKRISKESVISNSNKYPNNNNNNKGGV